MDLARVPRSLRFRSGSRACEGRSDFDATPVLTAVCVLASGSAGAAEAQQASSTLPAVTVDAPVQRARAAPPKPSVAQIKARTVLRRKVREARMPQAAPVRGPAPAAASTLPTFARAADANPYADPAAPYKADRLSSNKFTEPLLNTPKTVTVLTKEVLEDKNATSLKEVGRSTAGVTLGSGEGGTAFGDRFFIRGFDARNDVFVDGVRDPGVSVRENFFTEQVEILRGPGSSFAGRGTTGGAINIVTKKAGDVDFTSIETQLASDQTKRVTIDVNRAINPVLDVRLNGLFQDANVAGRNYVTDDRNGVAGAITFKPISDFVLTADYAHSYLNGLPDFGVPYDPAINRPYTEGVVPRNTYYGFVYRDFTKTTQNIGTLNAEYQVNPNFTIDSKFRQGYSILNYIGTIPEKPTPATLPNTVTLNAQSRFQTSAVLANQTEGTFKFDTGPIHNTAVLGGDVSQERISIDSYTGLTSEAAQGQFNSAGSATNVSVFSPPNFTTGFGTPALTGDPSIVPVETKSVYLIDTANYRDVVLLNGGVRFDDYTVRAYDHEGSVGDHSALVNYNVGLTLKPRPNVSVYGAYATSANPVGAELDGTSNTYGGFNPKSIVNQIFGPERSAAIEIGNKYELFDRHLLLTGALFQTNVMNARETVPTAVPASTGLVAGNIVAGAAYRIQGIDLEAEGKITKDWSLLGGLVLMKSKVSNSVNPLDDGLQLANIANRSFNLLTKYQIFNWFELGGQAVYASQIYGGSLLVANASAYGATPSPTILPSHWRFDSFAEFKIGPYSTLKVGAINIFNRTYYDAIYQSNQPFIQIAPGRTVYLTAAAHF